MVLYLRPVYSWQVVYVDTPPSYIYAVTCDFSNQMTLFFTSYLTADDKPYGAFLAYNFSDKTDKFTRDAIQDWVPRIRDTLEAMGYSVYDERKDGFIKQG